MPKPLRICLLFCATTQFTRSALSSILGCADELNALNATVYLINDCPGDVRVTEEIASFSESAAEIDLEIHENERSCGYVSSANNAFELAKKNREDLILLSPDTEIFPGSISEMVRVAYLDPMIGFVSPRSNVTALCAFPHGSEKLGLNATDAKARYEAISELLPELTYVPAAAGFCLLIKWNIFAELEFFDPAYGQGGGEDNDLVMRANRLGYRAGLANRAFVWRRVSANLKTDDDAPMGTNAQILRDRYPEFPQLIEQYFSSPEYKAEHLLSTLSDIKLSAPKIGFDLTNFEKIHNGTFELGCNLLKAAADTWPKQILIHVFCDRSAFEFHELDKIDRLQWVAGHDASHKVAAVIRIGQPYEYGAVKRLIARSPVIAVFMLDTISADCGYLQNQSTIPIWNYVFRWSDLIFSISDFSLQQIKRRFHLGRHTRAVSTLLSTNLNDYRQHAGIETSKDHLLVVGNHLHHKAIEPTVTSLVAALPNEQLMILGSNQACTERIKEFKSGTLSKTEMSMLYSGAKAVIMPSHYEGFGFPVLHALANKKPLFLRKLPPFLEIVATLKSGAQNIYWFDTTDQLVGLLSNGIPEWIGPQAEGEDEGWSRCARQILTEISARWETVSYRNLVERLDTFVILHAERPEDVADNIGTLLASYIRTILRNRVCYVILRATWRSYKVIKTSLFRSRDRTAPSEGGEDIAR